MKKGHKSIAFFVYPVLRFPRNNREYFLTQELKSRDWQVVWLVPKSGKNEGVPVEDYILTYCDLDVRGRTYLLPVYLGLMLRAKGIKYLWISGWSIRSEKEIYWLVRIMRMLGIAVIYDTIDPKCLIDIAGNSELENSEAMKKCQSAMNEIYSMCSRVLCVTPEMKALMIRKGADESRLFVARWGADSEIFNRNTMKSDFRKRLLIEESTVLVGWLGGMGEFKGLMGMLLPLMEKILKDRNIHFLIAGDGPLFKDVEAWAASQKDASITLMGRLSYKDAAEFTAALDVYLVTTDPVSEYARAICPIKCYDAVAAGTPLVTTRTPATEHLLQISANTHLCEYDINSFEKAVRNVVADIENIRKSRTRGMKGIISHQSVSIDIADMLEGIPTAKA